MIVVELISLLLIVILCTITTKSDLQHGIIRNKTLLIFAGIALCVNVVYYGYFVQDLFVEYLINFLMVSIVSLALFYTHSFAGGDCKLTIVLALLYPARFYVIYGESNITLIFIIAFAIFAGYCYLLIDALWAIMSKKVRITSNYIKSSLWGFLKNYLVATIYITLLNLIFLVLSTLGMFVNVWITRLLCLALAFFVGKYPIMKRPVFVGTSFATVVAISYFLKIVPISTNLENYSLALILLFCQMAIKTVIYETIAVSQLKKGMILSTMSSVPMQLSITKGLPKISTEDLRSRLNASEIESIKLWAKATRTETLVIVKKIPFAIFIAIGITTYFILWGVLCS